MSGISTISVARATLFCQVCMVLGISYLAVRASLSIESFKIIFADMLGGRPLPALTTFVLGADGFFLSVSLAIPVAAIALLFMPKPTLAIYCVGVLALASVAISVILYHAMTAPLAQIISSMSGMQ